MYKEERSMNISASSSLLNSLYSECLPLVVTAKQHMDTSTTSHKKGYGNVSEHNYNKFSDRNYDDDDNIAFLSSVKAPSELCMSLACVARRREAVRRCEVGPLLVFVPFKAPREEVFVEIPISAFVATNNKRQKLYFVPLNEFSILCSHVKDGLPPQKGVFVTFRSAEAQQRFRNALEQVISDCSRQNMPLNNKSSWLNTPWFLSGVTEYNRATENVNGNGREVYRTDAPTGRSVTFNHSSHEHYLSGSGSGSSISRGRSRAKFYIDNLLAERDKRREDYIAKKHGPLKNNAAATDVDGDDNFDFEEWTRLHQKFYPKTWSVIDGAMARQEEKRRRAAVHNDTIVISPESFSANGINLPLQESAPLMEREKLLCELRAAMEAYDNMSAAEGCGERNLMGIARQFLRQHQADLWLQQHEQPEQQQRQKLADSEFQKKTLGVEETKFSHLLEKLPEQTPEVEVRNLLCGGSGGQCRDVQQTNDGAQHVSQTQAASSAVVRCSLEAQNVVKVSNFEDTLQKELQRASEVESRILSSFQEAAAKPIMQKCFFTDTQKIPSHSSSLMTTEKEAKVKEKLYNEENKADVSTKALEKVDLVKPTDIRENVRTDEATSKPVVNVHSDAGGKSQQCGCGWKEVRDPSSGKNYYVHMATKKTTWKIEETFNKDEIVEGKNLKKHTTQTCGPQWRAVTDPKTNSIYYVHRVTKKTTWKIEETFADENSLPQANVTVTLQQPQQRGNNSKTFEWAECKDPKTGKIYYFNKKTKKTTWNRSETDLDST